VVVASVIRMAFGIRIDKGLHSTNRSFKAFAKVKKKENVTELPLLRRNQSHFALLSQYRATNKLNQTCCYSFDILILELHYVLPVSCVDSKF